MKLLLIFLGLGLSWGKETHYNPKVPALIDARAAFDYSMSHLENSVPIRPSDYALDGDWSRLARKLSALGVHPERGAIVFCAKDKPECGYIAWVFRFLGISDVRLALFEKYPGRRAFGEKAEVYRSPYWSPTIQENLRANAQLVKEAQTENATVALVDVREPNEFEAFHLKNAKNIPWRGFVDEKGDPLALDLLRKLHAKQGIREDQEIIYYSENGLASSFAAFAALKAGMKVRNYDGPLSLVR